MANHEIRPGSWGKVPGAKLRSDGRWVANGRYKNLDGAVVQRFRTGSTAWKAEDSLLALFQELAEQDKTKKRLAEEKLATKRPHLTDVLFTRVVEEWITYIQAGGQELRVSTAYEYARMARADIVPALGELLLADIDIKACADFLHGIVEGGRYYAKAEHNRAVLSNILKWCAGRGLIDSDHVKKRSAELVVVPDVIGEHFLRAREVAQAAGLTLASPDPDGPPISSLVWPGDPIIASQSPAPGTTLHENDSLRVWLRSDLGPELARKSADPSPPVRWEHATPADPVHMIELSSGSAPGGSEDLTPK
jgi:hypothetical protein